MSRRISRHQLLLSGAAFVGALSCYGRAAHAICDTSGAPVVVCSGAQLGAPQTFNYNDAAVSTVSGFGGVNTAGTAITITGDGAISYTDLYASPLTGTVDGLRIETATPGATGSITVNTNGDITGGEDGISAQNNGTGDLTVGAYGTKVEGTSYYGIFAANGYRIGSSVTYAGTNLSVTTGVGTTVTGGDQGILTENYGTGDTTVTVNGDVTGGAADFAMEIKGAFRSEGMTVTTAAGTKVEGGFGGIYANHLGSGPVTVNAYGDVYGGNSGIGRAISASSATPGTALTIRTGGFVKSPGGYGIGALSYGSANIEVGGNVEAAGNGIKATVTSSGTTLTVETAAGTAVTAGDIGIFAGNNGSGATTVTANGDVTGTSSSGIYAATLGTDLTVTSGTDTTVMGGAYGINARNNGSGATTVTANGDVTGTGGTSTAIYASSSGADADGNSLIVTTEAGTTVTGGVRGITANSTGNGATTITANGNVTGTVNWGILAQNSVGTATDLTVTTGADTTVSGGERGIAAVNFGSGVTTVTANGNVTANDATSTAIYARSAGIDPDGNSLIVTTAEDTTVSGGDNGIDAKNFGSGALTVTVNGAVTSAGSNGGDAAVNAENSSNSATGLTVTTGADSNITSGFSGIRARNFGTEAELRVNANGYINGLTNGIAAIQNNGADLIVTTGADSNIIGQSTAGIQAVSGINTGAIRITVNGEVTGSDDYGILADHDGGGEIFVNSEAGSTITGGVGLNGMAIKTTGGVTNLTVAGAVNGGTAGAIQFDSVAARDDRLELRSTAVIDGNVFAGDGTDILAFGGTDDGAFDLSSIDTGAGTQQFQDFETFQVESGVWNLSGATSEAFSVTGGTLKGTGTFGGLTVNDGGTLAPGNSIGTITVNGAFALNAGAIFEAEVNAAGESDKVIVNGTVNLTGATLRVLAEAGNYQPKTDYTIIENDGNDAVTGEFADVTSNLAFLTPTVEYDAGDGNDVVLTLMRTVVPNGGGGFLSFCSVAESSNQCNVAEALDKFSMDNPLFLAVLNQTADGARQAFNALSGEIHGTVAGTLADDSRYTREAVLGRLMQATHGNNDPLGANGPQVASLYDGKSLNPIEPERAPLAFWTQGFGAWGDYDSDGNAASASRDLGGFISGLDADIGGSWRAGFATGASFSSVDVNARSSSADVDTYHLGGYIGGMLGGFALRGGGLYAWNSIDTSRAVIFPGFFERQSASYDADTGQLFGEIAYPTKMGGIALEPFGGLAFVSVDTDSFRERGGALASLRGEADQDVGYTTLGLRAATTMQWGNTQVTPHISAAWQHAFEDVTPGASLAFASNGIGFGIDGVPLAQNAALLDAGLDFALGENGTAGVSYSGQYGDGVTNNAVKGRITWLF